MSALPGRGLPRIVKKSSRFHRLACAILSGRQGAGVMEQLCSEVAASLAAEGFTAEGWAPNLAAEQDDKLRAIEHVAVFRDPLSSRQFAATVRMHLLQSNRYYCARFSVYLCPPGVTGFARGTVCEPVVEANWLDISLGEADKAFHTLMGTVSEPERAAAIGAQIQGMARKLTAMLAP